MREKKFLLRNHIVNIPSVKSSCHDSRNCVKFMYDLVGVAHVNCCGLFIFFDPLSSLGQSETAVLESSLQQTMAQSISSANWKQLRRADQILQDATTHYFREQGQDGGVQQLVSERDKCS